MRCTLWRHSSGNCQCHRYWPWLWTIWKGKETKTKRDDYVEYSHLESEYTRHKSDWAEVQLLFRVVFYWFLSVCLSIILFSSLFLLLFRLLFDCWCFFFCFFFFYSQCQVIILGCSRKGRFNCRNISSSNCFFIFIFLFLFLFIFVIIFCAINRHGNQGDLRNMQGLISKIIWSICL